MKQLLSFHKSACVLLALLAGCDDKPLATYQHAVESCVPLVSIPQQRAKLTETLFPNSALDEPYLCGFSGSGSCPAPHKHLDGVVPKGLGPLPSAQICTTDPNLVESCDRAAKHLLSLGLQNGDLLQVLEGATRMADLMKTPWAPPHYDLTSPTNAFARWLDGGGVDIDKLGACITGTPDVRNACLAADPAAPDKDVLRSLATLTERHNGVLVRVGNQLIGARQRAETLFASLSGPNNAATAQTGIYRPAAGPGMPLPQSLGTVFALRLLDGSTGAPETELEALATLPVYEAVGSGIEFFSARHAIFTAQANAFGWNAVDAAPVIYDAQAAADIKMLFTMLRATAATARAMGLCDIALELVSVYVELGKTSLGRVNLLTDGGGTCNEQAAFEADPLAGQVASAIGDLPAGWSASDQQLLEDCQFAMALVSVSVPDTVEESGQETVTEFWSENETEEEECNVGNPWPGVEGGVVSGCECTRWADAPNLCHPNKPPNEIGGECLAWTVTVDYSREVPNPAEDYTSWENYTNDLPDGHEVLEVLYVTITEALVETAYAKLLSSNEDKAEDPSIYVTDPEAYNVVVAEIDDAPDLNFVIENGPHTSITNAGVGWSECKSELQGDQSNYAAAVVENLSCPENGSGVETTCIDPSLNAAGDAELGFVPFAIAQRVCPEYVAQITGVLEHDLALDISQCTKPYPFTKAVQYFLARSPAHDVFGLGDGATPLDLGDRRKTISHFANEALLLAQPAATMHHKRASLFAVASDVASDNLGDEQTWFDTNAGLDNVEEKLVEGEALLADALDLILEFNQLQIEDPNDSGGYITIDGATALVGQAVSSYATCLLSSCTQNNQSYTEARFPLLLREAIATYRELTSGVLEVQWRKKRSISCSYNHATGQLQGCDNCLVGVDTDSDGINDDLACSSDAACADRCALFTKARDITHLGSNRLNATSTLLEQHKSIIDTHFSNAFGAGALAAFIESVRTFASNAAYELRLDRNAMLRGIDWFGLKSSTDSNGAWVPNFDVVAADGILNASHEVERRVHEVISQLNHSDFSGQVSAYFTDITNLGEFVSALNHAQTSVASAHEEYCLPSTDPAYAPDCDSEWSDGLDAQGEPDAAQPGHALVARVNQKLQALCARNIQLYFHYDGEVLARAPEAIVDLPPEECPQFTTPSFDAIVPPAASGQLPLAAQDLKASLSSLEIWLDQFERQIAAIEATDLARTRLLRDYDERINKNAAIKQLIDGLKCAAAVVGAIACVAATSGACAAAQGAAPAAFAAASAAEIGSVVSAFGSCTAAFGDEFLDLATNPTPTLEELQFAFQQYESDQQRIQGVLNLTAEVGQLVDKAHAFERQVTIYRNLQVQYARALSIGYNTFSQLANDPRFDPTHQRFDLQTLSEMKSSFRSAGQTIRLFHQLVAYDMGQKAAEGGTFTTTNGQKFYLPRLSELTVARKHSQLNQASGAIDVTTFWGAANDLQIDSAANDGQSLQPGELNLVAYASLIYKIWENFGSAYSTRMSSGVRFVGGSYSGLPLVDHNGDGLIDGNDGTNPGERAMLGASPFWDPVTHGSPLCPPAHIDLRDYCSTYSDPATHASTDEIVGQEEDINGDGVIDSSDSQPACLDVGALPASQRYSLTYLDHMVRGNGGTIELFECHREASICLDLAPDLTCNDWQYTNNITVGHGSGGNGEFTETELQGCPFNLCANSVIAEWTPNNPVHLTAQTPTVRRLFERYNTLVSPALNSQSLNVDPGTYLWLIDMAADGQMSTRGGYDLEEQILVDHGDNSMQDGETTMAEHIAAMALVCSDQNACPGSDPDDPNDVFSAAQIVRIGPSYLGDRCVNAGDQRQQERVRFSMSPTELEHVLVRYVSSGTGIASQVESVLDNEDRELFDGAPLHTNGLLVAMRKSDWPLYRNDQFSSAFPRIRLALEYTFYSTSLGDSPFAHDPSELLQCASASSCVRGTCP